MYIYQVTVKPVTATEPGAFVGLTRYDSEAYFELDEATASVEIYTVYSNKDLDTWLDRQPDVIEYEVQ